MYRILACLLATAGSVAQAAELRWQQLHAPKASASSFLKSNWNKTTENYHPSFILDADPNTSWVEGAKGSGAGEWVGCQVSRASDVAAVKLRIRNGYQKSSDLLRANGAPKSLRVTLFHRGQPAHESTLSLASSKMGWSEHQLALNGTITFDEVRLQVMDVRLGSSYQDLCISDAELFIKSESGTNVPMEQAKHQALLAWVGRRHEAAAFFAAQPVAYPFAVQFDRSQAQLSPVEQRQHAQLASDFEIKYDQVIKQGSWEMTAVKDQVREPEGLELPDALRTYFSDVSLFEAKRKDRKRDLADPSKPWIKENAISNIKRQRVGTKDYIAFEQRQVVKERSMVVNDSRWLIVKHQDRVVQAARLSQSTDDRDDCTRMAQTTIYDFGYEGDKVHTMTQASQAHCKAWLPNAEQYPVSKGIKVTFQAL